MKMPQNISKSPLLYVCAAIAIVAIASASIAVYRHTHQPASQTPREQALSAYKEKDYSQAQTILKDQAEKSPDATTYNILANVSRDKGESDAAITYYKKAIELDPKLIVAYTNLASLYINSGQKEAATTVINSGLEIAPDNTNLKNLKEETAAQ
jgi:tetratricopeptide (TPR) repeat protein